MRTSVNNQSSPKYQLYLPDREELRHQLEMTLKQAGEEKMANMPGDSQRRRSMRGELKLGYKQTEVGVIPEDWE